MKNKKSFIIPEAEIYDFTKGDIATYDIMSVSGGDMGDPLNPLDPVEH